MRRYAAAASAFVFVLALATPAWSEATGRGRLVPRLTAPKQAEVGQPLSVKVGVQVRRSRRPVHFRLDFGDGTAAARGKKLKRRSIQHTFARKGTFSVRLKVVDARGHRQRKIARVVVRARAPVQTPTPAITPSPQPGPAASPVSSATPTPPPPLDLDAAGVELAPGSTARVQLPQPLLAVTQINTSSGAPDAIKIEAEDDGIGLSSPLTETTGSSLVTLTGTGCVPDGCDRQFVLRVPLILRELEAPSEAESFTSASDARVAQGTPLPARGTVLQDELLITLGTPDSPGTREQADAAAAAVDGTVSGGSRRARCL